MGKSEDAIIGLDPGPRKSAAVLYGQGVIGDWEYDTNEKVMIRLREFACYTNATLVIEKIEGFGMAVGKDVFETVFWSGRFAEAWEGPRWLRIGRRQIKLHLCNSVAAKDANIRQAVIDRFAPSGGGKTPQIGTKQLPGPLYGMKGDLWAALAVAITYVEMKEAE